MELTIITGRAGSGKSRALYRRLQDIAGRGQAALLLVPEQVTLAAETALLTATGLPGILDVQVMSPSRLMEDVFARLGGGGSVIDGRGKAMALRRVAEEHAGELKVFGAMVRRPGFAARMIDLISDLKRFDVAAEDLVQAAAGAGDLLGRKLQDIALLCRAMEEFLGSRRFFDEEDRMAAFAAALPRADFLRGVPVFVDEFDYLPPRTVDMLSALLSVSGSLTVALTADLSDREGTLFEAGNRSVAALSAMAGVMGCQVTMERAAYTRLDRAPALRHLEAELYASRTRAFDGPAETIRLYEAASAEQEVESAAGCIAALVREKGLRWRDIAVVCADLPAYLPRVEQIFRRHGIPVFLDNRRPVLQHPLVGLLLAALGIIDRGWRQQDVVAYLKTGYAGVTPEQTERLERYLAGGWYRGAAAWGRPFVRAAGTEDGLEDLNAWREAIVGPLSALEGPARRPASRWAGDLQILLKTAGVEQQLAREVAALDALGEETSAHSQMAVAVTEMLAQAAGLLGGTLLSAAEMADLLESGFAAAEMGVLPSRGDAVQVGDVGRTKTGAVRHLFVLGTLEGSLPVRYPEGGLLHDRDMDDLARAGVTVGRSAALRTAQSRQGVYAAFAQPTDGLRIFWPRLNDGDRPPSPLVPRLRQLFGLPVLEAPPPAPVTRELALSALAGTLRELSVGRNPGGTWERIASTLAEEPGGPAEIARLMAGRTPPVQRLDRPALPADGGILSSSQLEQYARCRFAWFVQYGLRPSSWMTAELKPADAGSLAHRAMEELAAVLAGQDTRSLTDEQARAMMTAIYQGFSALPEQAWREQGRSRWIARRMGEACAQAAGTLLRQLRQGSFVPLGQEVAFGPGRSFPAIQVGQGDAAAQLAGRIDRVDVFSDTDADYLRVIDYKTGHTKMQLSGAMEGWQLQLWLYLAALCRAWPQAMGRPARPAGAWYFPVRDDYVKESSQEKKRLEAGRLQGIGVDNPRIIAAMDRDAVLPGAVSQVFNAGSRSGALRSPREMDAILSGVMDTTAGLVADIAAGDVTASPLALYQGDPCGQCEYRGICQGGIFAPLPVRHPAGSKAVQRWIAGHSKEDDHA